MPETQSDSDGSILLKMLQSEAVGQAETAEVGPCYLEVTSLITISVTLMIAKNQKNLLT